MQNPFSKCIPLQTTSYALECISAGATPRLRSVNGSTVSFIPTLGSQEARQVLCACFLLILLGPFAKVVTPSSGDSSSSRSNSSQVLALHTRIPQPLDTGISSAGSSVSPTDQLLSLAESETTKTLQGQAPHSPDCNKQRQFSCPPTCVHH